MRVLCPHCQCCCADVYHSADRAHLLPTTEYADQQTNVLCHSRRIEFLTGTKASRNCRTAGNQDFCGWIALQIRRAVKLFDEDILKSFRSSDIISAFRYADGRHKAGDILTATLVEYFRQIRLNHPISTSERTLLC